MAIQTIPVQTIRFDPTYLRTKRMLDILFTLLISPFILIVSAVVTVLILLDSKGPILYRQKRIGQDGVEFEMLKFRSMYIDNNDAIHREAVRLFMNGEKLNENDDTPYKLKNDPRITRV